MADEAARKMKSVKSMDPAIWERGVQAADKRGENFATWLGRAIERQADLEADDRVIPPDERRQTAPEIGQTGSVEVVATLAASLAAIGGVKGCGGSAQRMRAVLDQHLMALALAPLPAGRRPGRLALENGQTG